MFGILSAGRGFRIAVGGGGVVFWGVVGSWFLDERIGTWTAAGVCVGLLASATVRTTMNCTATACTGTTACAGMTCTAACTRPVAGVVVTGTGAHSGASAGAVACVGVPRATTGAGGARTVSGTGAGAAAGVGVGLRATTAVVCAAMACATPC